jgi:hypothetical protein
MFSRINLREALPADAEIDALLDARLTDIAYLD